MSTLSFDLVPLKLINFWYVLYYTHKNGPSILLYDIINSSIFKMTASAVFYDRCPFNDNVQDDSSVQYFLA